MSKNGKNAPQPTLQIGLVADAHYAEKDMAINRYYRESIVKMAAAMQEFREANVDLAIDLGDLIDSGEGDAENLARIKAVFAQANCPAHHVLGNHCVERLSKREYLDICGQRDASYSFDFNGTHIVILDGCFRRDGISYDAAPYSWTDSDIPRFEQDWLAADLRAHPRPILIFVHQRLDADDGNPHGIASRDAVRKILRGTGNVIAVVQGHQHGGDFKVIDGMPYVTLPAMAEGTGPDANGYSILSVFADGRLNLEGFGRHERIAGIMAGCRSEWGHHIT